ncbi:MAG TPA: NAD-dependent epimerase/dehydratase family protein [Candidatus Lokiarchaeia archaeon]|nr:NAD-dependent epimerase/dehydratase family protein [Candidatus Lokiarchaeia archaeon]
MTDISEGKILITGGTGHLGSALIHHLVGQGVAPQNLRVMFLEGTPTESLQDIPTIDLFPGNVLDVPRVDQALEGVTHVFHMVGNTTFDPFKKRGQWLVNVEGTRTVAEACLRASSVEKMVYTSTVNTLGAPEPAGSIGDEETSPYTAPRKYHSFASPEDALDFADAVHAGRAPKKWWNKIGIGYFDSKLAAQEIITRFARDNALPVVSVLPGTNFGPYDHFIGTGTYLLQIYKNRMPGYTPGGGFPLTHVCDQAEGHLLAMTRGQLGERYIICGRAEDNLSLGDMLQVIAELLQEKDPYRIIKVPKTQIPVGIARFGAMMAEFWAKITGGPCLLSRDAIRAGSFPSFYTYAKAERELGFAPKRTFRQAVADMFDYYKAHNLLQVGGRVMDKVVANNNAKSS